MQQFLTGTLAAGYAVAALFFLRFWWTTRDRLFAIFAGAFALLAATRVALAATGQPSEPATWLYWLRFLSFALISWPFSTRTTPGASGC